MSSFDLEPTSSSTSASSSRSSRSRGSRSSRSSRSGRHGGAPDLRSEREYDDRHHEDHRHRDRDHRRDQQHHRRPQKSGRSRRRKGKGRQSGRRGRYAYEDSFQYEYRQPDPPRGPSQYPPDDGREDSYYAGYGEPEAESSSPSSTSPHVSPELELDPPVIVDDGEIDEEEGADMRRGDVKTTTRGDCDDHISYIIEDVVGGGADDDFDRSVPRKSKQGKSKSGTTLKRRQQRKKRSRRHQQEQEHEQQQDESEAYPRGPVVTLTGADGQASDVHVGPARARKKEKARERRRRRQRKKKPKGLKGLIDHVVSKKSIGRALGINLSLSLAGDGDRDGDVGEEEEGIIDTGIGSISSKSSFGAAGGTGSFGLSFGGGSFEVEQAMLGDGETIIETFQDVLEVGGVVDVVGDVGDVENVSVAALPKSVTAASSTEKSTKKRSEVGDATEVTEGGSEEGKIKEKAKEKTRTKTKTRSKRHGKKKGKVKGRSRRTHGLTLERTSATTSINDDWFEEEPHEINFKDLQWGRRCVLGRGASGEVLRVSYVGPLDKYKNTKFAMKVVRYGHDIPKELILREIRSLHESLDSLDIVRLYEAYHIQGSIRLLLEYMDVGSLLDVIEVTQIMPEEVLGHIAFRMLRALAHLESRKIIHRDIKPSNILLGRTGDCRLTDFGMSKRLTGDDRYFSSFRGTFAFMSPERLQGEDHTYNADIWSLGLTIIQCALGKIPFRQHMQDMWSYVRFFERDLERWKASWKESSASGLSAEMKEFCLACLVADPRERATATSLLQQSAFIQRYVTEKEDPVEGKAVIIDWVKKVYAPMKREARRKRRDARKAAGL